MHCIIICRSKQKLNLINNLKVLDPNLQSRDLEMRFQSFQTAGLAFTQTHRVQCRTRLGSDPLSGVVPFSHVQERRECDQRGILGLTFSDYRLTAAWKKDWPEQPRIVHKTSYYIMQCNVINNDNESEILTLMFRSDLDD